MLIVHESSVRELALADFKQKPELALQAWGRIEGKVQWGDMVDSNRTVTLSIHRDAYGYPGVIAQSGNTTSAGDGTFRFERVLPGLAQISCPIAKQTSAKLEPIIAARLTGLEKDDITQRDRCARLEADILADARSRLPELSVQKVLLSLDIQ